MDASEDDCFEGFEGLEGLEDPFVWNVVLDVFVEERFSFESEAMAEEVQVLFPDNDGAGEAYSFKRLRTICLSALGTGSPSLMKL